MYLEHFGLNEPPFRITPHTDFFFDGADRGATLEALLYAILNDEGIVKVSGEVGSGKTMLCRVLMERLPENVETIYLTTPSLGRDEILYAIADELRLGFSQGRMSLALRELQEHLIQLYAEGRRVVVLIDEAHAMPEETLEQVRLLSNLETGRHKLLQIVLFGQPELDQALARPSLRQLKDRITHSFRIRPLSEAEVARYLAFRMRAAGYRGPEIFAPKAVALIARASGGLTRRINVLADKSLLSAFSTDARAVASGHARAAIADSPFSPLRKAAGPSLVGAALLAGVLIGVALHWALPARQAPKPTAATLAPTAPRPAPAPAPEVTPEPQPAPLLSPAQEQRMAAFDNHGQRLLGERIGAARRLLARAPDNGFSLQLFLTDNTDPVRMERFLARARALALLADIYVIPVAGKQHYRLRVIYGKFADRASAVQAGRRLPPKYRQAFHARPRSFAELRRRI
jgi:type II secretory pathway predicted ATPase ExeA